MTKSIHVATSKQYDVVIGEGLLSSLDEKCSHIWQNSDAKALLVFDSHVGPLYENVVASALKKAGIDTHSLCIPAGEGAKSPETLIHIVRHAACVGLTRSSVMLALGGGVTGDICALAASTYMRGCHLVQLPTSLLAMVDSSVGGKTAVDLPEGKNLFGTFFQPDAVICDIDCLSTLHPVFVSDGMGEIIKYALLCGDPIFKHLEEHDTVDEHLIASCVAYKRDIVSSDEREAGIRKLLNLGHTIAHGIELKSGYTVPHGHAVGAGLAVITRSCASVGLCSPELISCVENHLRRFDLPTSTRCSAKELAECAALDKKRTGAAIDLVVINDIGSCRIESVAMNDLEGFLVKGLACDSAVYAEDGPRIDAAGEVHL